MTTNQQHPIIILVDERDDITHTPEWPQCKDMTCPCQDEVEDRIADQLPTEAHLDEQERIVTRCDVLIADLDRYTARLREIAADSTLDYPGVRAGVVAHCSLIAIWAHVQDPDLKAALDRLTRALDLVK